MTLAQSIFLGFIQGLTEFLPISSSGHLVLVPYLLNWKIPAQDAFVFDVLVQVATLSAVFAYFWTDIKLIIFSTIENSIKRIPFDNLYSKMGYFILIGTIPAGLAGLLLKDKVESSFSNPLVTAGFLFGTAAILLLAEKIGKRNREYEEMKWTDSIWVGIFQAFAIFPGFSRSGTTIVGGMTRNLKRIPAARFSFLLSIPAMLAAGLLAVIDLLKLPDLQDLLVVFIPGFIVSALTGYFSIRWLLGFLTRHPLILFSIYCATLATITFLVEFIR